MEEIKALISEIAPHIQCTKSSAKNKYRVDYTQLTDAVTNKWRYWMRNDFLDQDEIYSRILSNEYIDELANTIALRKPMHNTNKCMQCNALFEHETYFQRTRTRALS
eukprot:58676_1